MSRVEVLVHVLPADSARSKHFELLECSSDTLIASLKAQIEERGTASGAYSLPATEQELTFLKQICEDGASLADYGICEDFIKQVTGFVAAKKAAKTS